MIADTGGLSSEPPAQAAPKMMGRRSPPEGSAFKRAEIVHLHPILIPVTSDKALETCPLASWLASWTVAIM
jgi:hypothetical protein